ncbi:hypothetical protein A3K73_02565 [Candidatus Pacearchaeota archaeon RBG_13_36_9]|nr:MAG: hypothetical protein A3K73_02565 [Candidatus Pacearchaeota archaeon RBG_13_36_9]
MENLNEKKGKRHFKIIAAQIIFLFAVVLIVYLLYPRTEVNIEGTVVKFNSINANVIIISENPDFSNPRYLNFEERKNISFSLKPGTYYWKASNGYIEGVKKEFTINSEVGMKIDVEENNTKLVNIGNVKLNVSKNSEGMMVGHIILETEEEKEIDNSGEYVGRQDENL